MRELVESLKRKYFAFDRIITEELIVIILLA